MAFAVGAGVGGYRWCKSIETGSLIAEGEDPGSIRVVSKIILALAATAYALLWGFALCFADRSWDGLAYHIPSIALWAQHGHVHWVDKSISCEPYINGYPKAAELVGYIMTVGFRSSMFLNCFNLLFLPLGVVGLITITRELGCSMRVSLATGAAYVLIPVNIGQTVTSYVDCAYSSCVIAAIAVVLVAFKTARRLPDMLLFSALLGCSIGLVAGVKGTGLLVSIVLGTTFAFVLAGSIKRCALRSGLGVGLLSGVLVLLFALVVGGYWYVRNWLIAGSPLYPVGLSLAGHTLFPGMKVGEAISADANTPEFMRQWSWPSQVLFTWCQGLSAWPGSIRGAANRLGGLGYFWLLGCVPSIALSAVFIFQKKGKEFGCWILLAIIVSAAFLGTPMRWWARYTVWIYALGLPVFSMFAFGWARARCEPRRRFACCYRAWLWTCGIAFVMEASFALLDAQPIVLIIRNGIHVRERPKRGTNYWFKDLEGTALDVVFRADGPIAVGKLNVTGSRAGAYLLVGLLVQPVGKRLLLPVSSGSSHDEVQKLRHFGVRYVILSDTDPPGEALRAMTKAVHQLPGFILLDL
jgi:hypothetical protein